ncbi:MAG: HlyC/CorC family transporter [Rhodanobacter sp.]
MIATVALILFLLALSAFFSGSETALTAASRSRMHALESQDNARAGVVNRLRVHMERVIGAILISNNLVNILASALATSVLIGLFGESGVIYATIAMTVLIVLFGEVLPKTYAINNPDRTALAVAPIMRVLVVVLSPLTRVIQIIVRGALRCFGVRVTADLGTDWTEEELRGAIDLHAGSAEEVREAGAMLHSILDLDDVSVEDIMVHRRNVTMIDADQPAAQIVDEVLASPYTRLPLWREEPDNIVGVLHVKALLRAVQANLGDVDKLDIVGLASPAWFIPESTTLLAQLRAFRARREHFALVVDEYGALMGIVTLEDILEEIVGDISDEHDVQVAGVEPQPDGSFVVAGVVTLRDLNREFGWRLPDEEASTIAGLVLHEARQIPERGQVFVFHGMRFEILERQRNQIVRLLVTPPGPAEPNADEDAAETQA